jgi:hypothetical protein
MRFSRWKLFGNNTVPSPRSSMSVRVRKQSRGATMVNTGVSPSL